MAKISIVATIRASLRESLSFVNYHLNIGIDHLVLFFDAPEDEAIETLKSNERVTCIPCDTSFRQANGASPTDSIETRQIRNANLGLKILRDLGFDWIIHMDVDELLYPDVPIHSFFEGLDQHIKVVRFKILEALPDALEYHHPFSEISTFKVPVSNKRQFIAKLLGCSGAFYQGEYFRGHTASKSAVRTSAEIGTMGLHLPYGIANKELKRIKTEDVMLLHFDGCGFNNWKLKWERRLDGSARATHMRDNRIKQLEEFKAQKKAGNEALIRLYKKIFFLSAYENKVLFSLNMLQKIHISDSLFEEGNSKIFINTKN